MLQIRKTCFRAVEDAFDVHIDDQIIICNRSFRKRTAPPDPWGQAYQYKSPGEHGEFDLMSFGKDGRAGGTGEDADITNW